MAPSSFDPHLAALLVICAVSFVGAGFATVRLLRSGRAVQFPDLAVRRRAASRSEHGDHVPNR